MAESTPPEYAFSAEVEKALVRRVKLYYDKEAFDHLLNAHNRRLWLLTYYFCKDNTEWACQLRSELYNAGAIALWKAIFSYDPQHASGARLWTFAGGLQRAVWKAMLEALRRALSFPEETGKIYPAVKRAAEALRAQSPSDQPPTAPQIVDYLQSQGKPVPIWRVQQILDAWRKLGLPLGEGGEQVIIDRQPAPAPPEPPPQSRRAAPTWDEAVWETLVRAVEHDEGPTKLQQYLVLLLLHEVQTHPLTWPQIVAMLAAPDDPGLELEWLELMRTFPVADRLPKNWRGVCRLFAHRKLTAEALRQSYSRIERAARHRRARGSSGQSSAPPNVQAAAQDG